MGRLVNNFSISTFIHSLQYCIVFRVVYKSQQKQAEISTTHFYKQRLIGPRTYLDSTFCFLTFKTFQWYSIIRYKTNTET